MKNQKNTTRNAAHYCVYEHVNKLDGKRYIGMTGIAPKKRWGLYGAGYACQPFGKVIQAVGWNNFEHNIIAENLTREEAEKLEKELINKYKTMFPGFGYNVQRGNIADTPIVCIETNERYDSAKVAAKELYMSDYRMITRVLNNLARRSCGKHWATVEWAEAHPDEIARVKQNPKAFIPSRGVGDKVVYCVEAQAWSTIKDFAERFEVEAHDIHRVLDKPTRTCGNMHFTSTSEIKPVPPRAQRGKRVMNTTTGEEYLSIQAAVNALNVDYNRFYRALKKDGLFGGCQWVIR